MRFIEEHWYWWLAVTFVAFFSFWVQRFTYLKGRGRVKSFPEYLRGFGPALKNHAHTVYITGRAAFAYSPVAFILVIIMGVASIFLVVAAVMMLP